MGKLYYTLIFVINKDKVLLGKKRRGFGEGKWNGYGGKLEKGENMFSGAVRELEEESGLKILEKQLNYVGMAKYLENGKNKRIVYLFTCYTVTGSPIETDEMTPQWFNVDNIPYDSMWPDSKLWVDKVLQQYFINAKFIYNNDELQDSCVRYR